MSYREWKAERDRERRSRVWLGGFGGVVIAVSLAIMLHSCLIVDAAMQVPNACAVYYFPSDVNPPRVFLDITIAANPTTAVGISAKDKPGESGLSSIDMTGATVLSKPGEYVETVRAVDQMGNQCWTTVRWHVR